MLGVTEVCILSSILCFCLNFNNSSNGTPFSMTTKIHKINRNALPNRNELENLIVKERLQELVFLEGFNANLEAIFGDAYFTLLCSKYEGFPNVLLESLNSGTPVVSFDCKSGPSDLVQNGKNGILVEDQNFEALTNAMNKMVNNKEFYETCKSNANASVEKFSSIEVIKSWENLINKS